MVMVNEIIGDVSLSFCPWLGLVMLLVVHAQPKGHDGNGEEAGTAQEDESDMERNGPGRVEIDRAW